MLDGVLIVSFLFGSVLLAVNALNFMELRRLRKRLHNAFLYSVEALDR